MKKFILLILLIGVNCNCGVPCSTPPIGSYTKTCSNICYDSNSKTLTAICNDKNGNPKNTSLTIKASDTNIFVVNVNGDLKVLTGQIGLRAAERDFTRKPESWLFEYVPPFIKK